MDDIVIAARWADFYAGESYVVFGTSAPFPAEFELSSLASGNGSTGFVLNGIDPDDLSGTVVGAAGDIHGDGVINFLDQAFFPEYFFLPHGPSATAMRDLGED